MGDGKTEGGREREKKGGRSKREIHSQIDEALQAPQKADTKIDIFVQSHNAKEVE